MKSSFDTSVVTPVDELWTALTDVDRLVTVLPEAGLVRDGDSMTGSLKCKFGSTQVTYRITASATVAGGMSRAATIVITGTEARGDGTLDATLTVAANEVGDQTRVELGGEITSTGRGEAADARSWARVLESYLRAVLPEGAVAAEVTVAPTPTPTPTPTRSAAPPVAVPPIASVDAAEPAAPGPSVPTGPIALAAASVVVLLIVARRRRRRQ